MIQTNKNTNLVPLDPLDSLTKSIRKLLALRTAYTTKQTQPIVMSMSQSVQCPCARLDRCNVTMSFRKGDMGAARR